jgi:hypothetical protein
MLIFCRYEYVLSREGGPELEIPGATPGSGISPTHNDLASRVG